MERILIVDDDPDICKLLHTFLSRKGYKCEIGSNAIEGLKILQQMPVDLVISDFRMPDLDGVEFLKKVKAESPSTSVIIITGYSDVRIAVQAIKYGAFDYVTKPLYPDELLSVVKNALNARNEKQQQTGTSDKKISESPSTKHEYVLGNSPQSKNVMKNIELVAPTDISVIIQGETGTGKEFIAKEIHLRSKRANRPFIAIDCGALPKDIAESELFGHEKGSFTGAIKTKEGSFKLADGGTLFLDEIGNLSYEVQIKLLRVLQERKFRKVGGAQDIDVDIRILAASNEDLRKSVANGEFREDLFHRLNEFSIAISPLRKRKEDILQFAKYFIDLANTQLEKNVEGMDDTYQQALSNYSWPGNLRELRNVIKRSVLIAGSGALKTDHLPPEILIEPNLSQPLNHEPVDLKSAAEHAEKEMILNALKETGNNKSKAAKMLNIDRKTLYNKLKSYGIH